MTMLGALASFQSLLVAFFLVCHVFFTGEGKAGKEIAARVHLITAVWSRTTLATCIYG